jgi:hypothetical protein
LLDEVAGTEGPHLATEKALAAMLTAASGLVQMHNPDIADDAEVILEEFRKTRSCFSIHSPATNLRD